MCVPISQHYPRTMPSLISFKGVGKEELKTKGNKKATLQDSKKGDFEKEIFEPTSKRSLSLTQGWKSGLSFEAAGKIPNRSHMLSYTTLVSFVLAVDFLRGPLSAAGNCHQEQKNEDVMVMSPSLCLSLLIQMVPKNVHTF